MSLLGTQNYFKPFEHPWMFDYWDLQQQMHWIPNDVPLNTDVKDWNNHLTDEERNLVKQIFRLFTQSDVDVGSAYIHKYMKLFRKPEAQLMMSAFANMEGIHQVAYSQLLETIGMPDKEYKAFAEYEEMANKHEYLLDFKPTRKNKREIAKALQSTLLLQKDCSYLVALQSC